MVLPQVGGERTRHHVIEGALGHHVLAVEHSVPIDGRVDQTPHPGVEPGLVLGERGVARNNEGVELDALTSYLVTGSYFYTEYALI